MGDFSDNYIGIDNRFYGDGTGGTTRPLDTLLENMLDSSTRWMVRRRHLATQTLSGGDRTYASLFWMAVGYTPVYLDPGISSITCTVPAIISDPKREAEGGTTNLQARLRVQNYGSTIEDWAGDGTLQKYDITHSIDTIERAHWNIAFLEILSEDEGLRDGSPNFDAFDDYWIREAASTPYNLDPGEYVTDDFFVFMPISEVEYRAAGFDAAITDKGWPFIKEEAADTEAATSELSVRSMGYIQPRGFVWSATVDDEQSTSHYTVKQPPEMHANEPVLGTFTTRHLQNLEGVYSRDEIKAIGPQALDGPNFTWGTNHQRWPTAYANDGANQSFGTVSFFVDRDVCEVEAQMWLQFCHVVTPINPQIPRDENLSLEYATEMDWTISGEIQQLLDETSTPVSIATDSVDLEAQTHWIAGYTSRVPILQQAFYSYFHQDANGSDGYMWYEGSIMAPPFGDLTVMLPVTLRFDVAKADLNDFDNPVQLKVEASPSTSTINYELGPTQQDQDRIQCRLITMAVNERGTP